MNADLTRSSPAVALGDETGHRGQFVTTKSSSPTTHISGWSLMEEARAATPNDLAMRNTKPDKHHCCWERDWGKGKVVQRAKVFHVSLLGLLVSLDHVHILRV